MVTHHLRAVLATAKGLCVCVCVLHDPTLFAAAILSIKFCFVGSL